MLFPNFHLTYFCEIESLHIKLCAAHLLTDRLPNVCSSHHRVGNIKISSRERFCIEYNVLNLWVFPSGIMNVLFGNILLLTTRFFDVGVFTTITPLWLLFSCECSFPVVSFKISSLSSFTLKSLNKFYVGLRNVIEHQP
jgi:hypothetical protein